MKQKKRYTDINRQRNKETNTSKMTADVQIINILSKTCSFTKMQIYNV